MQPTNLLTLKNKLIMQNISFTQIYPKNHSGNPENHSYSSSLAEELLQEGITLQEHSIHTEDNETAHLLFLEAYMTSETLESRLHRVLDWNPIEYKQVYFKYSPKRNIWIYCFTFTA